MPFPFEVSFDELRVDPDAYGDAVFDCLESEFMVMPRGKGFVEFPTFGRPFAAHRDSVSELVGNLVEIQSANWSGTSSRAPSKTC